MKADDHMKTCLLCRLHPPARIRSSRFASVPASPLELDLKAEEVFRP